MSSPPPSGHPSAQWRRAAADAYRQACLQDTSFAPHAELVFEQEQELGRGGMGVVYRVKDRRLGRPAALKVMLEPTPDAIVRFRREAEITARLDHPGIPPLYEAGTTPQGQHYMLMRVVGGQTLEDAIETAHAQGAPLGREGPIGELLQALTRVCESVAYAHSQGVIHRDLKPENVLLGQFGEVLVMDWGLARDLSLPDLDFEGMQTVSPEEAASAANPGLTQVGSVIGSPGYMPPEQASGEEAGTAADVFALGAILVAILTGRPPIEGATAINRLTQTVQGKFFLPRARRPDAPPELHALAESVLRVDPEDRLPSARAFLDDLRAYLADEEPSVYRYSFKQRVLRAARKRSGLLLAGSSIAILLALAGVLGAGLSTAQAQQLAAEAAAAEATAKQEAEARARLEEEASRREAEERARRAREGLATERAQNKETRALQEGMNLLADAEHMVASGQPREEVRAKIQAALATSQARFLSWQAAQLYLQAGDHARARLLLDESIERYPPAYRERFALHRLEFQIHKEQAFAADAPVTQRLTRLLDGIRTPALRDLCREAALREELNAFTHFGASIVAAEGVDGEQGNGPNALLAIGQALELRPDFPEAWVWQGVLLRALGRRSDSIASLRRAVELSPREVMAWLLLYTHYYETGQSERCLEALEAVMANSPPSHFLLHDRASVLSDLGRHVSAIEEVKRGLALAPEDPELLLLQVQVYLSAKRNRAAAEAYRRVRAREDCRERPKLWYWGARAEIAIDDYPAAKLSAQRALELAAGESAERRAQCQTLLGRAHYLLDEYDSAIACFDEAAALDSDFEYPRYLKARAYHLTKRWPEAIAAYTEAAKLAPTKAITLTYRGSCRWYAGDLPGARADFARALALNPKDHEAYGFRARLELYAGAPQAALRAAKRALELRPGWRLYLLYRGAARLETGNPSGALQDLEKVAPYFSKRVEALLWRGRARVANGQTRAGRADFERALTLQPKPEERSALEAELAKLAE